jgi:hypothetical protein
VENKSYRSYTTYTTYISCPAEARQVHQPGYGSNLMTPRPGGGRRGPGGQILSFCPAQGGLQSSLILVRKRGHQNFAA